MKKINDGKTAAQRYLASDHGKAKRSQLSNAYHARRKVWINAYKVAKGCMDCGYNAHACALDFDHRDPHGKHGNVARMATYGMDKLMAEIEKCDVVCSNCHRVRTLAAGGAWVKRQRKWPRAPV